MKKYKVIGRRAGFSYGKIKLTDEQYQARKRKLKEVGNGVYEILEPIMFKFGEEISYGGCINKSMVSEVVEIGQEKPVKKPVKKKEVVEK
jgi:hypothetical protein